VLRPVSTSFFVYVVGTKKIQYILKFIYVLTLSRLRARGRGLGEVGVDGRDGRVEVGGRGGRGGRGRARWPC
jgi:hypothetical protein